MLFNHSHVEFYVSWYSQTSEKKRSLGCLAADQLSCSSVRSLAHHKTTPCLPLWSLLLPVSIIRDWKSAQHTLYQVLDQGLERKSRLKEVFESKNDIAPSNLTAKISRFGKKPGEEPGGTNTSAAATNTTGATRDKRKPWISLLTLSVSEALLSCASKLAFDGGESWPPPF
jgi:hypothetical protein